MMMVLGLYVFMLRTVPYTVSPDNGFTTSIELEVKIGDLEME